MEAKALRSWLLCCLILLAAFTQSSEGSCESQELGIRDKVAIPDRRLTSSSNFNSSTPAKNARLGLPGLPWCAADNASSPYLQVDLGSLRAVCAIATQGDSHTDQWVGTYQLQTSTNGTNWTYYSEGGQTRVFQGNLDGSTTVKQILFQGIVTQFVRIVAKNCKGLCCLRLELYGASDTCEAAPVGITNRATIPDHRMTATTFYSRNSFDNRYRPYNGRLSARKSKDECAWEAKEKSTGTDYLQVDLGGVFFICALATKGNACDAQEWTETYKIYLSSDGKSWNPYTNDSGVVKIFDGNNDKDTPVTKVVPRFPSAKLIRFWPVKVEKWTVLRVEVYGIVQGCRSSLGMELGSSPAIPKSGITTSSNGGDKYNTRLYGTATWCSSDASSAYVQVDLGGVKTVTGVATQGHNSSDKWVKKFTVRYKYDGSGSTVWQDYETSSGLETFDGNDDRNTVRVNWFPVPIVARYIRVTANSWNGPSSGPCLRMDLYGCSEVLRPVMTLTRKVLPLTKGQSVDVVCKVISQPQLTLQWWLGNTNVTSQASIPSQSPSSVSGVRESSLRVSFTSVDEVAATYSCVRGSAPSRVVTCSAYNCTAFYKGAKAATEVTQAAAITVQLAVRAAPTVTVPTNTIHSKQVTVQLANPTPGPNEGSISSYGVQYRLKDRSGSIASTREPSQPFQISDLEIYTSYEVRVNAESKVGEGVWSSWVEFRTDSARPTVNPVITNVEAKSSTSIQVTWQGPASGINGPFIAYRILYKSDGESEQTKDVQGFSNTTTTIGSLKIWTEYTIKIRVKNDKGLGPASAEKVQRTEEAAPSKPPSNVAVTVTSSTSADVSWQLPPEKDRNGVITGFKLKYRKKGGTSWTTKVITDRAKRSSTLTGLSMFTYYDYQVLAYTSKGDGPPSSVQWFQTPQDAPSKPTRLAVHVEAATVGSPPRATLTWAKPAQENGVIKGYNISYSEDTVNPGEVEKETLGSSVFSWSFVVLGGTTYSIAVSASTIKPGPNSTTTFTVLEYAPSFAPSGLTVEEANGTTFNVSWRPLPRNQSNGAITDYEVSCGYTSQKRRRRADSRADVQAKTSKTWILLTGLASCRKYSIKVRAYTSVAPGPYTDPQTRTTAAPTAPRDLTVVPSPSTREISLKWKKPERFAEDVKTYTIEWRGSKSYNASFREDNKQTFAASELQRKVSGLTPDTDYEFQVSAKSSCGEGVSSNIARGTTAKDAPPPLVVKEIEDHKTDDTSVNVTLSQASDLHGQISSYHVIVQRTDGEDEELPSALELLDYAASQQKKVNYYVTATMSAASVDWSAPFTVGDGKSFGDYDNVKLKKGETYTIYEMAAVNKDLRGKPAKIARVEVASEPPDESSTDASTSGAISPVAWAVPVVLVLLIVPLIVVLVWRRRRQTPRREKETPYKLNPVAAEASNEFIAEDNSPQQLAQAPAPVAVDAAAEGIYCEARDDSDHQPIPVMRFNAYVTRMKSKENALLKEEYKSLDKGLSVRSYSIGKRPENKQRNRYANIMTYNESRVLLETLELDHDNDYVNASYIPGNDGQPRAYIATQGPTDKTLNDFWLMVWQQKSTSIVMLTNLVELGKAKCTQYWPTGSKEYGSITVTLHKEEVFADYIVRTLVVKKGGQARQVLQFHFVSWPDKGVPQYPTAVLTFRRKVRSWKPANSGPPVMHCSAGVGRTGTYIVIDAMIDQAKKQKTVDIFNFTRVLRENRPYMVQTDEQYVFIHDAVLEALTCGNTEIVVHDLRVGMNKLAAQSKGTTGYAKQFQRLQMVTQRLSEDEFEVARESKNAHKNRFPNVLPLDSSRVILRFGEQQGYINASFADAYRERNAFVMTQAPLESTMADFWLMALQYNIGTIVMLNNLQEGGQRFPQYWPSAQTASYGEVIVEFLSEEKKGDIIIRTFKVDNSKNSRQSLTVRHHQHTRWPDRSVPASHAGIQDLMTAVQQSQQRSGNETVIVHCSDGVGRSGTFCAVYSAVERVKLDQLVDVFQTIKLLRAKRPGAVDTLNQYVFCYEAIQKYLDSFSDYANFSDV